MTVTITELTTMNGKSIRVKIFGNEYPLRGENEEFTRQVAEYVDDMLTKIHEKLPEQPPLTIAVLSALNISEDLLKERESRSTELEHVELEIEKLSNYLDNCLALDDQNIRS
ncbi:MAG: cell division protein ZapA [Bacteroidetes bacterium]|nr:cell division protein ZapA [Bacteroidota bacterium]